MDKAKVIKFALTGASLVFGALATLAGNKVSDSEMKATVAEEVAKALANQAKES